MWTGRRGSGGASRRGSRRPCAQSARRRANASRDRNTPRARVRRRDARAIRRRDGRGGFRLAVALAARALNDRAGRAGVRREQVGLAERYRIRMPREEVNPGGFKGRAGVTALRREREEEHRQREQGEACGVGDAGWAWTAHRATLFRSCGEQAALAGLHVEESSLHLDAAPGEADEVAAGADGAMTGHDERDRVGAARRAHGAR